MVGPIYFCRGVCDVHKSVIFVFFIIVFYFDNTAFIDFIRVFYFDRINLLHASRAESWSDLQNVLCNGELKFNKETAENAKVEKLLPCLFNYFAEISEYYMSARCPCCGTCYTCSKSFMLEPTYRSYKRVEATSFL